MRTLRGAFGGVLTLLVIHALVARANAAQLSGLVGSLTRTVDRFLDPTVPAIGSRDEKLAQAAANADQVGKSVIAKIPQGVPSGTLGKIIYPTA